MSTTVITIFICDRCKNAFRRKGLYSPVRTTRLGWWIQTNGGGSRKCADTDDDGDLDKDLCDRCTEAFEHFLAGEQVAEEDLVKPQDLMAEDEVMAKIHAQEKAQEKEAWMKERELPGKKSRRFALGG